MAKPKAPDPIERGRTAKPQTISGAELSRLLNDLTTRRITLLVAEGIIPRVGRGRYELVPAVSAYVRYLQDIATGKGKGDDTHRRAQTDYAVARALKAQRDNEIASAELIPKADFVAAMQSAFAYCRARLLAIPTKLAPVVHICESVPEIKEKLTEAIHEAIDELSETRAVAISKNGSGNRRVARGNGSAPSMEVPAGPNRKRMVGRASGVKSGKRRRAGTVADRKG